MHYFNLGLQDDEMRRTPFDWRTNATAKAPYPQDAADRLWCIDHGIAFHTRLLHRYLNHRLTDTPAAGRCDFADLLKMPCVRLPTYSQREPRLAERAAHRPSAPTPATALPFYPWPMIQARAANQP
jgi:hypothetical protein